MTIASVRTLTGHPRAGPSRRPPALAGIVHLAAGDVRATVAVGLRVPSAWRRTHERQAAGPALTAGARRAGDRPYRSAALLAARARRRPRPSSDGGGWPRAPRSVGIVRGGDSRLQPPGDHGGRGGGLREHGGGEPARVSQRASGRACGGGAWPAG